MNKRCLLIPFLALWTAAATAADWTADAARSKLGFVATYDRIPFETRFERFAADIRLDAARPAEGRMDVTIQTASVNSNSADRDDGMQGPEWFHSAKHPIARFVSRGINVEDGANFRLTGDLTIKGITRPVAFLFRWTEKNGAARIQGETLVKRTDFDIGTGEWKKDDTIGFEVKIVFDLQLKRK